MTIPNESNESPESSQLQLCGVISVLPPDRPRKKGQHPMILARHTFVKVVLANYFSEVASSTALAPSFTFFSASRAA